MRFSSAVNRNTLGEGRGSSVFDGWLDTMVWLEPSTNRRNSDTAGTPNLSRTKLRIEGRDSEQSEIRLTFNYPVWSITEEQANWDLNKTELAIQTIERLLKQNEEQAHKVLRQLTMKEGHSDSAFRKGIKQLESQGKITQLQDKSKQGNHKLIKLVAPPETNNLK